MTIAEVCGKYGLTADTLRYYEKIGLLPRVGRTSGRIRNYTDYDCNWIEFIKCMRGAGVSVNVLLKYVQLFEQGDATAVERKQMLIGERDRISAKIAEMQAALTRLNFKVDRYDKVIIPAEQKLKGNL
jgi:DNA-binding transcriptional MerR regulator